MISHKEAKDALNVIVQYLSHGKVHDAQSAISGLESAFAGYCASPDDIFASAIENDFNFTSPISIENIELLSYCEHHFLPIVGYANITYTPNHKILGIGKFAEIVQIFARRFQLQEKMNQEIFDCIKSGINPKTLSVEINAKHFCMKSRGAQCDANIRTIVKL